ncbi:MAG: hypothetical protein HQ464_17285 [Planctomycetes bacterium]|nr:hypothetical protein [Planctomycetota bacterium]
MQTYFLHIPRTSGRATHTDLHDAGVNLSTLSLDTYLSANSWERNSLLCGHFGNHPVRNNLNVQAFTLVRDVVSHTASMSVFAPEGVSRIEFAKRLIYEQPSNGFPFVANPQSSFISSDIFFAEKGAWGQYQLPRISFSNAARNVLDVVNFANSNNIKIHSLENRKDFISDVAECFGIYSVGQNTFPSETDNELKEFCINNKDAILEKHNIDHQLHLHYHARFMK